MHTRWRNKVQAGYKDYRNNLFESVSMKMKDTQQAKDIIIKSRESLKENGIPLHDKRACDSLTGKTVLHVAIENRKWPLVDELMKHDVEFELFRKTFTTKANGASSEKTCLIILVEMHGRLKKPIKRHPILCRTKAILLSFLIWAKRSKENMTQYHFLLEAGSTFTSKAFIGINRQLSPLHIACYSGDTVMTGLLLAHMTNPNVVNRRGETPLMWAMRGREPFKLTTLLLERKAKIDAEANDGSTIIHWAVQANNNSVIIRLLSTKHPKEIEEMVNKKKHGGFHYPLIQAAACGFEVVVDTLLKYGANVNLSNRGGQTALHYAAAAGNESTIRVLMKNESQNIDQEDKIGNTALMFAVNGGHVVAADRLIQGGAKIYKKNQLGDTVWSFAMDLQGNEMLKRLVAAHNEVLSPNGRAIISPLQVATHKNKIDKLKYLLNVIDRDETDDKEKNTFVHIAAQENRIDLLRETLLLEDSLIKAKNRNQDTPLHLATKHGHNRTVEVLLANGGSPTSGTANVSQPKNIANRTPLHESVCASSPRMAQLYLGNLVGCCLEGGEVTDTPLTRMVDDVDEQQNTCLHLAVTRTDSQQLVKELVKHSKNINKKNFEGNTALHLAAINGNESAIDELLSAPTIDLSLRNSMGRTVLHVAVRREVKKHSQIVVSKLLKAIGQSYVYQGVLAYKDHQGDTALHIACKWDRKEDVKLLVAAGLSPKTINNEGNNPLHVARFISKTCLKEALELFKGMNLDQENFNEETVLEVYAINGLRDHVIELIRSGADLSHTNKRNETMLHTLIRQSVLEPSKLSEYKQVYRAVCDMAVHWWCLRSDLQIPSDHQNYVNLKSYVIVHLTSELKDEKGYSVVSLAVYIGAKEMTQVILNTPGVYMTKSTIDGCKNICYDISGLSPASLEQMEVDTGESSESKEDTQTRRCRPMRSKRNTRKVTSCLDVLAEMGDTTTAVEMMKISPIMETVDHYWRAFQWLTIRLMFLHVIYMTIFSVQVYPALRTDDVRNQTNVTDTGSSFKHNQGMTHDILFGFFIPWPFLIMLIRMGYNTVDIPIIVRHLNFEVRSKRCQVGSRNESDMVVVVKRITRWAYDSMPLLATIVFPILVCVWYGMHLYGNKHEVYFATLVMLVGWLITVSFTLGIKGVHTFCEMFRYIMIRDVARFLCVYLFVLCAFLFSLHTMFQVVPELRSKFYSAWDTLFLLFNLMVGVGELFDADTDEQFLRAGYNPVYPKILYISYVILSMVIMVNLLIAMVNETYESVKSREGTTWRKSTVMFAVRLERNLQWLRRFFMLRFINCLQDYAKEETINMTLNSNQGQLKTVTWKRYVMNVMKDSRKQGELMDDDDDDDDGYINSTEILADSVQALECKADENLIIMQKLSKDMADLRNIVADMRVRQSSDCSSNTNVTTSITTYQAAPASKSLLQVPSNLNAASPFPNSSILNLSNLDGSVPVENP